MAALISIHPEWCEMIASGKKTLEVRKTMPKLKTPFKCYIYCTKAPKGWFRLSSPPVRLDGHVIGEFICDSIRCFGVPYPAFQNEMDKQIMEQSCLTYYQLHRYAYHDALYGWHISNLVIYDKPKGLSDFVQCHKCPYGDFQNCNQHEYSCDGSFKLMRPPQSWCYVEEATT